MEHWRLGTCLPDDEKPSDDVWLTPVSFVINSQTSGGFFNQSQTFQCLMTFGKMSGTAN